MDIGTRKLILEERGWTPETEDLTSRKPWTIVLTLL
jgi:hypothetical protein